MDPKVWGKHMWASIHFIALGYPDDPSEEDKATYKLYFDNLYKILPCGSCSDHLRETMKKHHIYATHLRNKDGLFKWTVDLHNIVNKRLHKRQFTLDEAYNMYLHKSEFNSIMCNFQRNSPKTNKYTMYLLIFIIIYIILFVIYGYYFATR